MKVFITAGLLLALFFSCNDKVVEPSKIYGTIVVENIDQWSSWQDSGVVELTIFPAFSLDPLAGWGAVPDDFFGPGVPGGTFAVGAPYNAQNPVIFDYDPNIGSLDYEITVEPGQYSALALGFRHHSISDPAKKTATLGVHWGMPDQLSHGIVLKQNIGGKLVKLFDYPAPLTIDIAEGESKQIDFRADFDFVNQWFR